MEEYKDEIGKIREATEPKIPRIPPDWRFKTSQTTKEIFPAFIKAQAKMQNAELDSVNPHFHSKYASLTACMRACKPALNAEGIAVVQVYSPPHDQRMACQTILIHGSGEWMAGELVLPLPERPHPQHYGSICSYLRRYSLVALTGLSPMEDDDANIASEGSSAAKPVKQAPKSAPKVVLDTGEEWDVETERMKLNAAIMEHVRGDRKAAQNFLSAITDNPDKNFEGFRSVNGLKHKWQFDLAWKRFKAMRGEGDE